MKTLAALATAVGLLPCSLLTMSWLGVQAYGSLTSTTGTPVHLSRLGVAVHLSILGTESNQDAPSCPNIYVSIPNDSCKSVAQRFNFSSASLLEFNYPVLDCNNLAAATGTSICVYCNSRFSVCRPVSPLPYNAPVPPPISSCQKTHTVLRGDSCWLIAQNYNITVNDLHRLNSWLSCYTQFIYAAQVLCVG
ncbi:hypothetical protein BASA50_004598 [Batrachochytrium salamandrivorans]|uniref:LysM domain-containing protein n=1 Tax=Batrachochytrium salamandrivorans TaxID=1357716 RepID=A0ABQ8FFI9_9FUNG|nr:hypothetical protein BASA50_004598 [Batrachochytrium salamandrivorans]